MRDLPFRQVHLDFHTSEHVPAVGERFDPEQFVGALKRGRVNSINVFAKCHHGWSYHPTDVGAARILLEQHVNFDVVDTSADFERYRLLILPDEVPLDDPALRGKVETFIAGGGTLVLSGRSGMDAAGDEFLLDVGAEALGPSPWCPDYAAAGEAIREGLVAQPFVLYERAQRVRVTDGEVLAEGWRPYFNREFRHFCSHQHTPPAEPAGYPAALRKGQVVYFAPPVFTAYREKGQQLVRDYVWAVIASVYGRLDVEVACPAWAG